jgi:hypothetical protein
MKRIIYDNRTGIIESCRNIPNHMLDKNLSKRPYLSYLNGSVPNTRDYKVNLETLQVEYQAPVTDLTYWIRIRRTAKLISSDWTQAPDSPLTAEEKAEWATYRQALRDMPVTNNTATSRQDVVWPTPPGA